MLILNIFYVFDILKITYSGMLLKNLLTYQEYVLFFSFEIPLVCFILLFDLNGYFKYVFRIV